MGSSIDLFKKRVKKNITKAHIISLLMVVFTAFYIIKYNEKVVYVNGATFGVAGAAYALRYIPLVILTGLCGNVPGMLCVLLVFAHRTVMYSAFSYMTFIYLLVVCVVDVLARKRWFGKWYKTLCVSVFLQLLVGNFWGAVLVLLSDQGISGLKLYQQPYFFLNEIVGCLVSSFIVYFIFKKLPDRKKRLFKNGKYYVNPDNLSEEERYEVEGKSRIGLIIMNIIIIEALLIGICAELASNSMMPLVTGNRPTAPVQRAGVDLATLKSSDKIEAIVSRQLQNEVQAQTLYFTGTILGNSDIDYRFSVQLAMLISMGVIPLAVFVNRYAQKRIAEPIRQLSKAVSGIYNSSDISLNDSVDAVHNLDISTNDEIEELYHSVDLTFYRLVEYIELVKARQNIEDQLEIAKSASEAKSRFLSNISHEIRTPINAVLGFDEMILRESEDKNIRGYAMDIQSSGKTLLTLINDILDFSKIEAGKMEIIPVEYELGSMLNDLYNMSEFRAKEKNLDLSINVDESIPHILFGDEIRIKQCILNIVTNAVKYTETGSVTIDVDYEEIEPENPDFEDATYVSLKVKVIDTGIGIREEEMDKLMTAFERADEKRNRTVEGTGLGISIVVSLLEMMGSKLEVESEYGKGSEFSFAIKQKVVSWEPIGDFVGKAREAKDEFKNYKESFRAENARILVVDDTRTNLTVIKGLLKQTKMQIDTATSGMEALEMVKKNKYHIIFLDHRMPEMDGIQTFHAMETMEDNLNKDTPCVALTANAISGSRELYIGEGFDNYMSKPVDPKKLEEMILAYLPSDIVTKVDTADSEGSDSAESEEEINTFQELLKISGVDINAAIERCGSAVVAKDVMKDFWMAIDERSGAIERYESEHDIKNYTIYVHGLKSSAKAVGALDLSEKAEYLEYCGNAGNTDEIEELTPELLELYRSYIRRLEPLFAEEESDKPMISPEELEGAFESIKEFVSASYFDSADDILGMLDEYSIPEEYKQKYHEVKRLLAAVDRDGLLNIL
jgi:signal transduction histidine kinase/DNA-binding NarL/FixJ family response regulator